MNNNVTILIFSTREGGNCAGVSNVITNFYNQTNVRSFVVEMNPCGRCNYECLSPGVSCPNVDDQQKEIMDAVCRSDIVYMIVPNFCGYPCANYFAFNERSVGYFNMDRELTKRYMSVKKRFIVISNTEGDNFRNALQQQTNEEPVILYLKSGKYKKRSTAGDIMESEEAVADLMEFLQNNC